jgi:peptidoglycan/LPS O-acetylase OafA/YrhL
MLLLSTALGALLIPSVKTTDVRAFGESYPLNGPMWSLFFEYIANIGYAFWIRKFSLRTLGVLSVLFAGLLTYVIVTSPAGSVSIGWMFSGEHLWKGMVRMLFPFLTGLFLFRLGKTIQMKHAIIFTSLALLVTLPMPRVGPEAMPWVNGLYECFILIILLPVVVLIGAGNQPASRFGEKACNFLGDLSYPLYLVHYPIHCIFFGWLSNRQPAWSVKIPVAIGVYVTSLVLGYVVMRFVDKPIRKRLARFAR